MALGTDALQAPHPGAPADISPGATMRKGPDQSTATLRYAKKREAVIAAATQILNQRGVKGMTLADVAASVGLITTSVTYYFKKKEDLAAACFLSGISRYDALIGEALHEPTPHARLHRFLTLYLELKARIRLEGEAAMPAFNDVRALTEPRLTQVRSAYADVFRRVRGLFDAEGFEWMQKRMSTARTHMIMEQLFWAVAWLSRYEVEDYPRIRDRMFDIFAHGLSVEGAQWLPDRLEVCDRSFADAQAAARDQFLVAATRLINREGYRGASVEKISAELNVTKGSFYHHNVRKDDLVVECFERTFRLMRATQSAAMRADGDQWTRLTTVASALVEYQLSDRGPLLRSSAFSALPETMRGRMIEQSNRVSDRFSAMISDGVAEGSVRPVDPVIAAQMLNATLNASQELRFVVRGVKPHQGADLYARPMLMGVFTP